MPPQVTLYVPMFARIGSRWSVADGRRAPCVGISVSCSPSQPSLVPPKLAAAEIRIGFASALSGPYAATGTRYRAAVEVAVEQLNRDGGLLGQPVRVITADDACGVEQAEAAAHALVDAGVGFVVGHLCSHSSLVAAAVYEAAGVPMLSTTSSHPRLTEEGRGNVFRLIGRDDRQGQIAGDFLAERWPRGKIAILDDGSTYGAGLADQTRRRLRERGVQRDAGRSLSARGRRLRRPGREAAAGRHRGGLCRRLRAGCGADRAHRPRSGATTSS